MAVFGGTIRSTALGMDTRIQVILPYDRPAENQASPCGVLYLLHGLAENSEAWCRYSRVEQYAREHGLAVIMPEVQRSFYLDMRYGLSYFAYITEELPHLCGQMFHISSSPEHTWIAGLSMGGYGALRCALAYPQRYAGAASFSGAVDIRAILDNYRNDEKGAREFIAGFGPELQAQEAEDLYALAQKACSAQRTPRLFLSCGEQDFLFSMNTAMRDYLTELSLDLCFKSWEGDHNWSFWDESLRLSLQHFLG